MPVRALLVTIVQVAFTLYLCLKVRKALHMLQLNSYRLARYCGWLSRNGFMVAAWDLLPLASAPLLLWASPIVWSFACVIVYLALFASALRARRAEKMPLVVTRRVKRLWVPVGILLGSAVVLAGRLLMQEDARDILFALAGMSVLGASSAIIALVANAANLPLEFLISQSYVRDAKRKLGTFPSLTVIGITGSSGKTTTKRILAEILSERFNVLATPASYNTALGVVRTIREHLKPIHEVLVLEMGARQRGDIEEICRLAEPRYGVLTGISEQHLETFGTIENIAQTKFELLKCLPEDGVAIVNDDDAHVRAWSANRRCVRFGIDSDRADLRAEEMQANPEGTTFVVVNKNGERRRFRTRLLGKHNVLNILAAAAVAGELGLDLGLIARAARRVAPTEHRLEARRAAGNVIIIDDSYNSNPIGAHMALEVLGLFAGYRKVLVTPGMIELGSKEAELNRSFGLSAAGVCDEVILVGPRRTLPIREGLREGGFPEEHLHTARDLKEASHILGSVAKSDSAVLFENDLPDNYAE